MKRTKSSKAWMREHVNDPYVRRAKQEGYRCRAAYKLLEIDGKDRLLKPGMTVVDLGAAPGGWSQVAAARVGPRGRVVAVDLLELAPIPGVTMIQGDFQEREVASQVEAALGGRPVDLVICDMAPNMNGIRVSDQARSFELAELALEFCERHLKPGGCFLVKVFQGAGFEAFVREMRGRFRKVAVRKPKSSRNRSNENYLLGSGRRAASDIPGTG